MASQLNLLPQPRQITLTGGTLDLPPGVIALDADPAAELAFAGRRLLARSLGNPAAGGEEFDALLKPEEMI